MLRWAWVVLLLVAACGGAAGQSASAFILSGPQAPFTLEPDTRIELTALHSCSVKQLSPVRVNASGPVVEQEATAGWGPCQGRQRAANLTFSFRDPASLRRANYNVAFSATVEADGQTQVAGYSTLVMVPFVARPDLWGPEPSPADPGGFASLSLTLAAGANDAAEVDLAFTLPAGWEPP